MVVWIIGLSGAGKTTLANEVIGQVRCTQPNVVLLDGDMIREVFGNDLGHTMQDRLTNARRVCQLGKFLEDQGINVVCAFLSLFRESRSWNRENLKNYYEVFIDTPMADLVQRDYKGLYRRFNNGEICDVAGMDIEFPRPDKADLTISNSTSREELLAFAKSIAKKIMGEANELSV
jgi:adenylylsulfate kinase-like enzyme